jgi:hypothetical protein
VIESPGGRSEAGLMAHEEAPEIDGRKPRIPVRQCSSIRGSLLARPNAKTRARSLYSKLGKVLALTGVFLQL